MTRLISVLGTPSPLFYATANAVRALTDATLGQHVVVNANSLAALRAKFPTPSARDSKPVVILSDYPQPDLLATLVGADAPMAVCADDFTTIAHLSVVSREFYGAAAARFASMALVNIEPIITAPPPYTAVVNDPRKKLTEVLADLADLYGLRLEAEKLETVLRALRSPTARVQRSATMRRRSSGSRRTPARNWSGKVRSKTGSSIFSRRNTAGLPGAGGSRSWNGRPTRCCGPSFRTG